MPPYKGRSDVAGIIGNIGFDAPKYFSENCLKFGHAPSHRPPRTLKNIGCKRLQNITGLGPTLVVIIPNTSECTGLPPSGPDLARVCAGRRAAGPDHTDLWPAG